MMCGRHSQANRETAEFEARQFRGSVLVACVLLVLAGMFWLAEEPLRLWHVTGADGKMHPDAATWIAYAVSGTVLLAVLIPASIRPAARRELTRARTAGDLPPAPASISVTPPACQHPSAEPLVNRFTLRPPAWFCADCGTPLPEEFGDTRRPCCGTVPGEKHLYNCRHQKG